MPRAVIPSVAGDSVTVPIVALVAVIVGVPKVELSPAIVAKVASISFAVIPGLASITNENPVPLVVSLPFAATGVTQELPVLLNDFITPRWTLPPPIVDDGLPSPVCHPL